jgi:hypothetical protein
MVQASGASGEERCLTRRVFCSWGRFRAAFLLEEVMAENTIAGVPGIDPTLPGATFVGRDGKTYAPVFSLGAIARILKDTGRNIITLGVDFSDPILLQSVILRSLERQNPDLTSEAVDELIDIHIWPAVAAALVAALGASVPKPDPEAVAADPPSA